MSTRPYHLIVSLILVPLSSQASAQPARWDRRRTMHRRQRNQKRKLRQPVNTSEFNRVKARLLGLSNAKASTTGEIRGSEDGAPGRPTLKRRQPTPDESTQPEGAEQKPPDSKPSEPPKLKRNPSDPSSQTDQSGKPKPGNKP
jgi:hypothetical protein